MNFAIVILGELNCNLLHTCPDANQLLDFITTFNLTQLVTKPTRSTDASSSLIDVIMITENSIVSSSDIVTCSISDRNSSSPAGKQTENLGFYDRKTQANVRKMPHFAMFTDRFPSG